MTPIRTAATFAALTTLWHVTALPQVAAQGGDAHRVRLFGRALGGSTTNLAGAAVTFHSGQRSHLACLAELRGGWTEPSAAVDAVTDAGGMFRMHLPSRDGVLVVVHPAGTSPGLGALVRNPQSPVSVVCRPVGELLFGLDSEVHVQAVRPNGEGVYLGRHRAMAKLRLPAGEYRLLTVAADSVREHHVHVLPGRQIILAKGHGRARTLTLPTGFRGKVCLRHWPEVPLPIVDGTRARLPAASHPLRIVVLSRRAGCHLVRELWIVNDHSRMPATDPAIMTVHVVDPAGKPVRGARVVCGHATVDGFRIASVGRTGERGHATVDLSPVDRASVGDPTVVVEAIGYAPLVAPAPGSDAVPLQLRHGHHLRLQILTPRGNPAADTHVELVSRDQPLLRSSFTTDATGTLLVDGLPQGLVFVRLDDPRFLAKEYRTVIRRGRTNTLMIRADAGFKVDGRVLLPGGTPAVGAVVTLRWRRPDAPPVSRTAVTGRRGDFAIRGLPEHERLRAAARWTSKGLTFISKVNWVQPGDTDVQIQLKSEDPALPGPKK